MKNIIRSTIVILSILFIIGCKYDVTGNDKDNNKQVPQTPQSEEQSESKLDSNKNNLVPKLEQEKGTITDSQNKETQNHETPNQTIPESQKEGEKMSEQSVMPETSIQTPSDVIVPKTEKDIKQSLVSAQVKDTREKLDKYNKEYTSLENRLSNIMQKANQKYGNQPFMEELSTAAERIVSSFTNTKNSIEALEQSIRKLETSSEENVDTNSALNNIKQHIEPLAAQINALDVAVNNGSIK